MLDALSHMQLRVGIGVLSDKCCLDVGRYLTRMAINMHPTHLHITQPKGNFSLLGTSLLIMICDISLSMCERMAKRR